VDSGRVRNNFLKATFWIYAALSLLLAGFHFLGIFYPVNSSPVWRHGLFVLINLVCAYGFLNRPAFFVYFFFLLLLQQLYSHGGSALRFWMQTQIVCWLDMTILLFMIIAFVLLVLDLRNRSNQ
jgi:hypothetical protein